MERKHEGPNARAQHGPFKVTVNGVLTKQSEQVDCFGTRSIAANLRKMLRVGAHRANWRTKVMPASVRPGRKNRTRLG